MNYATPAAFRMALEARLATSSRDAGIDLNRLRRRVAFERILIRLDNVEPGRWILKGGMALEIRWRNRARATRDLDLAINEQMPEATRLFETLAQTLERDPHGDWFRFSLGTVKALTADTAGRPGWRLPTEARLAGRQFAQVTIDVVARAEEIGGTERVPLPGALAFAGLPSASIEIIDREQHFAEKMHALTQTYGDRPNTRTRDLVDLLMLVADDLQPTNALRARVERVFAVRGTHAVPHDIPDPPSDWATTYPALAADLDVPKTIEHAMAELRNFWLRVRSN